ncbi:MAG: ABC transporter ATP-binding protein [Lachnospiraceae bacterium]|nr:ABC transporter ATP-binding protein [Lachnospiraceae bacterium]
MNTENIITGSNISKKFKKFELDVPELKVPKGYVTALIGENGAGKSTLLNIMSGIRMDFKGKLNYFEDLPSVDADGVRERIGFVTPNDYYFPGWTISQIEDMSSLLFDNFSPERFESLLKELDVQTEGFGKKQKKISELSDGNRMKVMLAGVWARNADLLILDEPASPLDPLMREKLCDMIRTFMEAGAGQKSVFFSTHNVTDMENVTDYCIIMEQGKIVEEGFVEDLKEKYVLVKGELDVFDKASKNLISVTKSSYGFEGLAYADKMDGLSGMDLSFETPTLSQLSVGIMRSYSKVV